MNNPKISIICALAEENRAIGKNNSLLWDIPNDLKKFRELTTGHPIIMGRRTYESIGKPLPNRTNIVLSHIENDEIEGCIVCKSIDEALEKAKELDSNEVFVIGGGQIYAQTINLANRLYLTLVKGVFEADTFFPEYSKFTKVISEIPESSNGYEYKYIVLEKP